MTTLYHTPIAFNSIADDTIFNAPLAQLDTILDDAMSYGLSNYAEMAAARSPYPSLAARLAAITFNYAGGNIATLTNGAASAGQKDVTVESTTGFIAGAYVAYLLVGGAVEYNVIASITPTTVLTMTTNIGTGGIANDSYIGMISVSEYQAANAIPHAGALTMPQVIEYTNAGVFNAAAYGLIDGGAAAANVTALNAAIAAAAASSPAGTVILEPGTYEIDGPITIATDGVRIVGTGGHMRSYIKCTTADSGIVIDKTGVDITYQVVIDNVGILGQLTATTGLTMRNANECSLRNVFISGCTTGVKFTGGYAGLTSCEQMLISTCTNAIVIEDGTVAVWFSHCNLWDSTTVLTLSGTTSGITIRDSWIERFDIGVLIDSTAAAVVSYSLHLVNNYWLSTNGGGSYTCRIIKATMSADNKNLVHGMVFQGNQILTTAAKYVIEVDWNGNYFGGDNRFWGAVRDNFLATATNMTAWITSDVSDLTLPWVWLKFDGNTAFSSVKPRDAANPIGGTAAFTADDATPSVILGAPIYKTANANPTTITMFDDGIDSQVIRLVIGDAVTTIDFTGTYLKGNGGSDWTPGVGDWLEAIFDGTYWFCAVHEI